MTITNVESGTNVHEVADGIYRINTPVQFESGDGFSFNQYLITDDEPLLFHTGPRKMFPLVREAVASLLPNVQHVFRTDAQHADQGDAILRVKLRQRLEVHVARYGSR